MATNITTLPIEQATNAIQPTYRAIVEVASAGTSYTSSFSVIAGAFVESVITRIGAEPGEAVIRLPIAAAKQLAKGTYGSRNFRSTRGFGLSPIVPYTYGSHDLYMYQKIRIRTEFAKTSTTQTGVEGIEAAVTDKSSTIFIGYITSMEFLRDGQSNSDAVMIAKDARVLMDKCPVQGMYFNDGDSVDDNNKTVAGKRTYIRDVELVFNEAGKPNRYNRVSGGGPGEPDSTLYPAFCRADLKRYRDDGQGTFVDDIFAENRNNWQFMPEDFALKWLPGHAINYMINMHSIDSMISNKIYNVPSATPSRVKLPPLLFDTGNGNGEIKFNLLSPAKGVDAVEGEFFNPRSFVGAPDHSAVNEAVSTIGEFNPTGNSILEMLFSVIRKVGNFTLDVSFTSDETVLKIIRTSNPFKESLNAHAGNGQQMKLLIASDDGTTKPDMSKAEIKILTDNYYNRLHIKGGLRWVQCSFETVGQAAWEDDSVGGPSDTQTHPAITDSARLPVLDAPSLLPMWTKEDQRLWLANSTAKLSFAIFPQVFRQYVVPDDLDWLAFLNNGFIGGDKEALGYTEFFQRERPALNHLFTSLFDVTLGLFKSQRQRLPVTAWRSFRGYRLTSAGGTDSTANGEAEGTAPVEKEWFKMPCDVEILTNPLRVRFPEEARSNTNWQLERAENDFVQRTPLTWNGLADTMNVDDKGSDQDIIDAIAAYETDEHVRGYDIRVTFPVAMDENVWNLIQAGDADGLLNIPQYGPALEKYRNEFGGFEEHKAVHSVIDLSQYSQRDRAEVDHSAPDPAVKEGTPEEDIEDKTYRYDESELQARVQLMANRHITPDVEAKLTIPWIDSSMKSGAFIKTLDYINESGQTTQVPFALLASEVFYDFQLQQTIVNGATIR